MPRHSRRDALKQFGAAGAGMLVAPVVLRSQQKPFVVAGRDVEIAVQHVAPHVVRIIVRPLSEPTDAALADGALTRANWATTPGNIVVTPNQTLTGPLTIEVSSHPVSSGGAKLTAMWRQFEFDRITGRVSFYMTDAPVLGLGQGGPQFDRRGTSMPNRSGQGAFQLATHGGRVPVQFVINRSAFYIHQPLGTLNFTDTRPFTGTFDPPSQGSLPMDIFVIGSDEPAAIMKSWAEITGYAELPPLWALGYHQSHRTLGGPEQILNVAKTFREKKLPCDSLIYLGTEFAPSGWNTRNGEFTWKPENFPDPKKQIDELHALNFKVTLHIVVEGRVMTGSVTDPCTAAPVPPGRTPDNQWPRERQVSCYWPAHKPLFDLGIDGWWPDQGDGYDAASRLARNRMYWEGSQMYRPNQRVFALHRNGAPGMQRLAAFLWSGDVQSRWETLKTHVPNAVNTALSGIPYWGTDIGGFVPTEDYTGELHVRWFQFGTFNTLFRAHGRTWQLRLPWGWNTGSVGVSEINPTNTAAKDPPVSELHNAAVEPIVKKYLELRYQLLPYTYTAVRDCHETGVPIVRAMWLHYPKDPVAAAKGDQYLWGRDILVAPVVEKGATSRKLYLPTGVWYDFWTNERTTGGREITRPVDLATMPLYVQAGAIIPLGPIKQYVDEPVDEPVTLVVYPGADGTGSIYEDDGKTFDYRKGRWTRIVMVWRESTRTLSVSMAQNSPALDRPRSFSVRLNGSAAVRTVAFEGKPISVRL